MIVESHITVLGMRIRICRTRHARGYQAELQFECGDRAVVDAKSIEELDALIAAITYPAAVARRGSGRYPLVGARRAIS